MILNCTTLLRHTALLSMAFAVSMFSWGQVDRSKAPEAGPAPELQIGAPTKLKLDKDRKQILERKNRETKSDKGKGKFTEQEVAMADVD